MLVACFKLTSVSPEISSNVLKTLYKNRRFADYDNVSRGLLAIFGPNSFRTYKLSEMSDLNEISIEKEKLPESTEDIE